MDRQRVPSGTEELWTLLQHTDGWQKAMRQACDAFHRGASQDEIVSVCLEALAADGLTPDAIVAAVPQQLAAGLSELDEETLRQAIGLLLTGMVLQAADGGAGSMPFAATHASWVTYQNGIPLVWSIATPLDPDRAIAEFATKCYQTFPPESFAYSGHGPRDAEWLSRRLNGDTYAEIARSDKRSGLSPEARARPDEYAAEVRAASDLIRKAVRRLRKKWTRLAASMSAEEA